ncbi:sensor histidine kinase [bacterium]|nr:sensor histidine kinase [bacterium]
MATEGEGHPTTSVNEVRLRKLAWELTRAREVERRKIAAELHDNIGQSLALMRMKLNLLQGEAVFSGMEKNINSLLVLLEQTIKATRSLTFEINPPMLHELGLVPALNWLAERFEKSHGVKIKVSEKAPNTITNPEINSLLFTCTRELVLNSIKYSGVKRITVETSGDSDAICICVTDKGSGFDADAILGSRYGESGFGLFSIRERIGLIGGTFTVDSTPGNGTRAMIRLPLDGGQP